MVSIFVWFNCVYCWCMIGSLHGVFYFEIFPNSLQCSCVWLCLARFALCSLTRCPSKIELARILHGAESCFWDTTETETEQTWWNCTKCAEWQRSAPLGCAVDGTHLDFRDNNEKSRADQTIAASKPPRSRLKKYFGFLSNKDCKKQLSLQWHLRTNQQRLTEMSGATWAIHPPPTAHSHMCCHTV